LTPLSTAAVGAGLVPARVRPYANRAGTSPAPTGAVESGVEPPHSIFLTTPPFLVIKIAVSCVNFYTLDARGGPK